MALAGLLAAGCATGPARLDVHAIRARWAPGCEPARAGPAITFDLEALGDFDPSADSHEILAESARGAPLRVTARARAVTLEATDGTATWLGAADLRAEEATDVTLWSREQACALLGDATSGYPAAGGGEAAGVSGDGRTVLVAGGRGGTPDATGAAVLDLDTGRFRSLLPAEGLRARRAGARVTPFADGFLVSGGVDPVRGDAPVDSADVYEPAAGRFADATIPLERPRSRHAAVALASGETLLVGGADANGAPLGTLEAVSPATRRYRISGLADLAVPRADPSAIRLTDDRILVSGGVGSGGAVEDSLEWLSPDGSRRTGPVGLSDPGPGGPTSGRVLAAMPGGSALAVGGCTRRTPDPVERARCLRACGEAGGCPATEILWITSSGRLDRLAGVLGPDADAPALVAGEAGRPWLEAR